LRIDARYLERALLMRALCSVHDTMLNDKTAHANIANKKTVQKETVSLFPFIPRNYIY